MLDVIGISKTFNGLTALINVSFQVNRGSITSVIGPCGAGKTTLLNIISGLCRPSAGEIHFEGKDISDMRPQQITRLGITRTFQDISEFRRFNSAFPNMSVLEHVISGFYPGIPIESIDFPVKTAKAGREQKDISEKAMEILKSVNMAEKKDSLCSSLIYEEQKRVELARAFVSGPKMILLDEPIAGLNISGAWALADLILKQKEAGTSVLLVEHGMDIVMKISDMIIVLDDGKKLAQGTPHEIENDDRVIEIYL